MKKILFLIFTLLLLNTLKAQNGFETQVSLGLPSNTLSKETSSFNAALNLGSYLCYIQRYLNFLSLELEIDKQDQVAKLYLGEIHLLMILWTLG
ncbi:hypothetical protein [Polaribacter sp. R77954]|uniref:hypothetical protein n=1 Tax=Polaribacter sp. R77954 TaxID=3093870 RepID=UPI0037CC5D0F